MQELAGVPEGKRDKLVEKVLSEGLSVRELKEGIGETTPISSPIQGCCGNS
jgi:hypothetical protein